MREQFDTTSWGVVHRPKSIKGIVGNSLAKEVVNSFIEKGKPPTCILISGPTGSAKTTLATLIAAGINGVEPDKNPDFHDFNVADQRGIDAIRSMIASARYMPRNKFRVILLDEAHAITGQALEALLKPTEMKGSTVWILSTTEPEALGKTILTRCYHITLGYPTTEELITLGKRITKREGVLPFSKYEDTYKALADRYPDARSFLNALQIASDLGKKARTPEGIAYLCQQTMIAGVSIPALISWVMNGSVGKVTAAFVSRQNRAALDLSFAMRMMDILTMALETQSNFEKKWHSDYKGVKFIASNYQQDDVVKYMNILYDVVKQNLHPHAFSNIFYSRMIAFASTRKK